MHRTTTGALATVAALALMAPAAEATDLVFLTGSQGGAWYPTGGAIKALVEDRHSDVSVRVRPGAGLANIQAIEQGQAQLALSNTISAVDAVAGREPFAGPIANICNIAYLYPQVFQAVVVNMDIHGLADFRDRRLAVVPRGNTAEQVAHLAFTANGLDYDDFARVNFASMSDQVNMMKDGQVDGFVQTTGVPAGVVMDVASSRPIRVLPVDDATFEAMREVNGGFARHTIPAGAYPGMDEPVETVAFGTHVIGDCGLDEDLVYNITAAMVDGIDDLRRAVAVLREVSPEAMGQDVGIAWHPGAERFYREHGLID